MESFFRSAALLFTLLNPFLLTIYLLDLIQRLDRRTFLRVLVRASVISGSVFVFFAVLGDRVFRDVLQARFAAFLIFGGIVFLVVSLRFVFSGVAALASLRGQPEHLAGAVAMPFMIGPATVSASVLIGARHSAVIAAAAVIVAVGAAVASLMLFKWGHDWIRREKEQLVERYVEVTGRLMALVMGTYAVDIILRGVEQWLAELGFIR